MSFFSFVNSRSRRNFSIIENNNESHLFAKILTDLISVSFDDSLAMKNSRVNTQIAKKGKGPNEEACKCSRKTLPLISNHFEISNGQWCFGFPLRWSLMQNLEIGTSCPAHYRVLWDENNFTADGIVFDEQSLLHIAEDGSQDVDSKFRALVAIGSISPPREGFAVKRLYLDAILSYCIWGKFFVLCFARLSIPYVNILLMGMLDIAP